MGTRSGGFYFQYFMISYDISLISSGFEYALESLYIIDTIILRALSTHYSVHFMFILDLMFT